ncbi:MAG TPA: 5-methyltetrahydropteroyltriglutamate--homocysteine S-methyltransferase [Candidatus Acidoferrales bacterium]|nr:5-methyltetrahydropteroyltriglutamate--homocysteine S-methyltransferase [Candidatus Acidoferrales bacterium]
MATSSNLGFPRMGVHRELKKALEAYWLGKSGETELLSVAKALRVNHWVLQKTAGIQQIPSNDFSLYDHVLDTVAMVGAVPHRYQWKEPQIDLETYFAMARGAVTKKSHGDLPAMEMTKWFDTNYHYIVPEFTKAQEFSLGSLKPIDEFLEAKSIGIETRPVLLGPVSFLLLGKVKGDAFDPLLLLEEILPIYEKVLLRLAEAGATWIQIDEPMLVLTDRAEAQRAFVSSLERLASVSNSLRVLVATYFAGLGPNLDLALRLPIAAMHLDLVRGPDQLETALRNAPANLKLSLGVIDGRNIWKTDIERALKILERASDVLGPHRVFIAPSCSLLHSPVDLGEEKHLDGELRGWLAFSKQKLEEIVLLERTLSGGRDSVLELLDINRQAVHSRNTSRRIHHPEVKGRTQSIAPEMSCRRNEFPKRKELQQRKLRLPLFPTTTIGSFPQTKEIREARAQHKIGKLDDPSYDAFLRSQTENCIRFQEEISLDVLVHGEFERNDMVEYFGEQLSGFAATDNGWVQSYGSRCVKPPLIYGDVSRRRPMTVTWSSFAQSLTAKPMKGMLTGPVTILQWSFVRDDQPRSETCRQIALAIRDEVSDLEDAGIGVIQIDEPALREGLPLLRSEWPDYLKWAVECFRLASSSVRDETQIHTHMCYAEFQDIIEAVAAMDADVISIETSRSQMELLDAFAGYRYPNDIGPGVYDIHSPRVPSREEMLNLLRKAATVLSPRQIWVNPDCGLKTRRWEEVKPSLVSMVEAAKLARADIA